MNEQIYKLCLSSYDMKNNFTIEGNEAVLKINKNIYPKEVLVQACYVKLENFYFLIDEEGEYYLISMRYKEEHKDNDLKRAAHEFFDELIESQSYIDQLKRTSEIRQTILERALLSQTQDREE